MEQLHPEAADRLARIETKLDSFIDTQSKQHTRLNNHGERLGHLEQFKTWVKGGLAVSAVAAAGVVAYFTGGSHHG